MPRDRALRPPLRPRAGLRAAVRDRALPFLRRMARPTEREQAAIAVALLAFLVFAAIRGRYR